MKNRITGRWIHACLLLMFISYYACSRQSDEKLAPNVHKVKVKEVLQGSSYSYIRVSDGDSEYWAAINKADIKEGNIYYWSKGGEMKEFTSRELKRTFRSIYFLEDFTDQPILADNVAKELKMLSMAGRQKPAQEPGISVTRPEGGITVGELYEKKSRMAGKRVKVSGKVIKYSLGIMNKNWVHIQDGTKYGEDYDLAISTTDSTKVGDIVIFEGAVSVDKNIGAGYVYSILIEDAELKK